MAQPLQEFHLEEFQLVQGELADHHAAAAQDLPEAQTEAEAGKRHFLVDLPLKAAVYRCRVNQPQALEPGASPKITYVVAGH